MRGSIIFVAIVICILLGIWCVICEKKGEGGFIGLLGIMAITFIVGPILGIGAQKMTENALAPLIESNTEVVVVEEKISGVNIQQKQVNRSSSEPYVLWFGEDSNPRELNIKKADFNNSNDYTLVTTTTNVKGIYKWLIDYDGKTEYTFNIPLDEISIN